MDSNQAAVLNNALTHIEIADAFKKRAMAEINSHRQEKQAADAKMAGVLETLVDLKFVPKDQVKEAEALLSSRVGVLELLHSMAKRAAEYRKSAEANKGLGVAAPEEKTAGVKIAGVKPWAMGAKSSEIRQSDVALMRLAGLPIPGE